MSQTSRAHAPAALVALARHGVHGCAAAGHADRRNCQPGLAPLKPVLGETRAADGSGHWRLDRASNLSKLRLAIACNGAHLLHGCHCLLSICELAQQDIIFADLPALVAGL